MLQWTSNRPPRTGEINVQRDRAAWACGDFNRRGRAPCNAKNFRIRHDDSSIRRENPRLNAPRCINNPALLSKP